MLSSVKRYPERSFELKLIAELIFAMADGPPVSNDGDITNDNFPDIDLGSFDFGFVTEGTTKQLPVRAQAPPPLGVLGFLEGKVFKGRGFNTIFRPRSNKPLDGEPVPGNAQDNDLELNLTQETLTFSKNIGTVPNRGLFAQPDIALGGITYVQSVQDVTNSKTGLPNGKPTDIHIEPGIWMSIPATPQSAVNSPTLTRMASIPHGTTINASGVQPKLAGTAGPPTIGKVFITPFIIPGNQSAPFPSQNIPGKNNRIPQDLDIFNSKLQSQVLELRALCANTRAGKGTITQDILDDPNTVLRNAIANQDIVSTVTFQVSTQPSTALDGGGTANIAFLGGPGATETTQGPSANAFAASMTATFWVETVQVTFTVEGGQPQTKHRPAGRFGPTFIVPPTIDRTAATTITATYTQLQYSQEVILNFWPQGTMLSWPHVSVATLGETSKIHVQLPAA